VAWTFRCQCGSERSYVAGSQPIGPLPWPCDDCGAAPAKGKWVEVPALVTLSGAIGEQREIPPHFNHSFDCHVEGRAHLKHLQALHGTRDYDPRGPDGTMKGPSTGWDSRP
jgi:hypothetical protein